MLYFLQNKKKNVIFALFFIFFILFPFSASAKSPEIVVVDTKADKSYPFDILEINKWQKLEKGVQFIRIAETIMEESEEENSRKVPFDLNFDVLKFDPAFFDFSVYGAMTDNRQIPSCAIIYENDPELDVFFLTNEKERTVENALKKYSVVIQNFKLVDLPASKSVWKGQRRHAIAAVAQDTENKILLMYASKPLTIQEFRTVLQDNPLLKIKRAMYTEGGVEAGMAYRDKRIFLWQHEENIMLFLKGTINIPNVIGIKRK